MKDFVFERRINYYETDKMGIVHHSNYIRFLEEARCHMLDKFEIPYSKIEECGVQIPVLGVSCEYKHHVGYDDIICINCKIKEFTGVRMTVSYVVTKKDSGELVMNAETKHCFTNKNLRPCNLKKYYPKAFEVLTSLVVD